MLTTMLPTFQIGGRRKKSPKVYIIPFSKFCSLFNIYSAHRLGPGKSIYLFSSSFLVMFFSTVHCVSDCNDLVCCNIMCISVLCIVALHWSVVMTLSEHKGHFLESLLCDFIILLCCIWTCLKYCS